MGFHDIYLTLSTFKNAIARSNPLTTPRTLQYTTLPYRTPSSVAPNPTPTYLEHVPSKFRFQPFSLLAASSPVLAMTTDTFRSSASRVCWVCAFEASLESITAQVSEDHCVAAVKLEGCCCAYLHRSSSWFSCSLLDNLGLSNFDIFGLFCWGLLELCLIVRKKRCLDRK
jgi:hypothetical protein